MLTFSIFPLSPITSTTKDNHSPRAMEWVHYTFLAPFNHVHEQTYMFLDKTLGGSPDSLFVPFLSCVVVLFLFLFREKYH